MSSYRTSRQIRHVALVFVALLAWAAPAWRPSAQGVAPSSAPPVAVKRPNIVFVLTDDLAMNLVQYMPMGEHRLLPGKMTTYDTDIHVPLIVTGPGVPPGRAVEQIVENVDLCPTFTELAGAVTPAAVDGRSLVPLLHGQEVTEWRTAALVEHRGPQKEGIDPDMPGLRSGNPTTYEAMRTRTSLYVEYADGDKEYHDLSADPYELRNTVSSLSGEEQASLRAALQAMKSCHGVMTCWSAGRPSRSATGR